MQETSTPSLAGFSFFQIAVDAADREHQAATTNGLYERVPSGAGSRGSSDGRASTPA